jgi:hypothetical protein
MAAPQVQVVGLRALNRDLQRLTDDRGPLNKLMAQAGRTAAEPVAAATRSALPQGDRPGELTGRLAGDVRVTASRSGASVRMGRSSIRYAGWVEFGGTRRTPHRSSRDYNPRGRYLFPNAVQLAARSARLYSDAVTRAFDNYPWTNTGTDPGGVHD